MYKIIALISCIIMLAYAAEWQPLDGPHSGKATVVRTDHSLGSWMAYAVAPLTPHGKIFRTFDGGNHWDSLPPPQYPNPNIIDPTDLAIMPTEARYIYITKWVGQGERAIWKSGTYGDHWTPIDDENVTVKHLDCITVDAFYPWKIYVGGDCWLHEPSVFKTTDSGSTWEAKKINGIDQVDPWIRDISTKSDMENSIVLAASSYSTNLRGIYRSVNDGRWTRTWTDAIASVALASIDIAFAGGNSQDGVYKSTDGGATWFNLLSSPRVSVWDICPRTSEEVWIATNQGIYVTYNGGDEWFPKIDNMPCQETNSVSLAEGNPSDVYVGSTWGVYKSDNGGDLWREVNEGFPLAKLSTITTRDNYIYCAGEAVDRPGEGTSIFRSPGSGSVWQTQTGVSSMPYSSVDIEVSLNTDEIILFAGNSIISPPEPLVKGVIYRSEDYGEAWDLVYEAPEPVVNDNLIHDVVFSKQDANTAFAGYYGDQSDPTPIKKSNNTGLDWRNIAIPNNPPILSLRVSPEEQNIVYAGTKSQGIYKSIDAGENWLQTLFNNMTVNNMIIESDNSNTIYISAIDPQSGFPQGVFKTTDGFTTTPDQMNNGLDYLYILNLENDNSEPTITYALCKENENAMQTYVYCTVDRASKWFDITNGLPADSVCDLEIADNQPDQVYAATKNGVYSYTPDFDKHRLSSSYEATSYNNGHNMVRIEGTDELGGNWGQISTFNIDSIFICDIMKHGSAIKDPISRCILSRHLSW